jgi:hypothetical protein
LQQVRRCVDEIRGRNNRIGIELDGCARSGRAIDVERNFLRIGSEQAPSDVDARIARPKRHDTAVEIFDNVILARILDRGKRCDHTSAHDERTHDVPGHLVLRCSAEDSD